MHYFPKVTLLVTHYNRSSSLERLLKAFANIDCRFADIVVSDDCSKPEHLARLEQLKSIYNFQLATTKVNQGLGQNINKGQDLVKSEYTLYVQEDFEPTDIFPVHFTDALQFMDEDKSIDITRFYAYFRYPGLVPFKKGFSFMKFGYLNQNHIKFYVYSDHPHLRRSNFFEKFGRYPIGINSDKAEYQMAIRFIKKQGKGLFFENFTTLFHQKNSESEPSTLNRAKWRESDHFVALALRAIYLRFRWCRNTYDVLFAKF